MNIEKLSLKLSAISLRYACGDISIDQLALELKDWLVQLKKIDKYDWDLGLLVREYMDVAKPLRFYIKEKNKS